jgi:hypothetical protein
MGQGTIVQYAGSDTLFPNPERGFYTHREVQAEGSPLSLSDLTNIRNSRGNSLILRIYYLKKFRSADLSAAQLALMETDFARMRQAGIKCVLRFAYSSGQTDPDAPLSVILRHLDQLKPVFEANHDVIAVIQAGFIAAWGEWYYSTNGLNNTTSRRSVLQKILETMPHPVFVQIRTPYYKQQIFNRTTPIDSAEAYSPTQYARTGHHNDCFLAAYDDWGTYLDTAADKAYLSAETRFSPIGGETCNPTSFSICSNAVPEMARMHWTYVNADYHQTVLAQWTNGGCMDEIKRRLGYRFEMLEGAFPDSARPGSGLQISLRLTNLGWAAPFNPRPVEIILRRPGDTTAYFVRLPADPRFWHAGDTIRIAANLGVPSNMPHGEYAMYLNLPDPSQRLRFRPEFAIRMANGGVWESATGYNSLLHSVRIDDAAPGGPYADTLQLRVLDPTTSVDEHGNLPPAEFRLHGNYPNPFNASTRIAFSLPRQSRVRIDIYSMLGQQVGGVDAGTLQAGRSEVPVDLPGLPSGIYFYRVAASGHGATGRMVLVR